MTDPAWLDPRVDWRQPIPPAAPAPLDPPEPPEAPESAHPPVLPSEPLVPHGPTLPAPPALPTVPTTPAWEARLASLPPGVDRPHRILRVAISAWTALAFLALVVVALVGLLR